MEFTISVGESRRSTSWKPQSVSWEAFCGLLAPAKCVRTHETMDEWDAMTKDERANVKDIGGYVGGTLASGSRRANAVSSRQLVALDADFASTDAENMLDSWMMMMGGACLVHSTHSHRHDRPRLRLLIPLTRPVTAQEYEPVARRLAEYMGIEDFDDTTYECNRLMFWPSCPQDGEYQYAVSDGDWTDPDKLLATYDDWHDMRQWPHSSRQERVIRRMSEKQGDPLTKPGIIGAFNRAYTITEAIGKYLPDVYTPAGEGRWTYAQGSTVGGAVSYDNDTFLYSHHDTDPVSGKLCSAFDLVRLHMYGDEDAGYDGDIGSSPSMSRMKSLCQHDEKVCAELADAMMRPDNLADFQDGLQRFEGDITDQGAAKDFVSLFGRDIRHNKSLGWLVWDGEKWEIDAEYMVWMLMGRYTDMIYSQARILQQTAADEASKEQAKKMWGFVKHLRSGSGASSLLKFTIPLVTDRHAEAYDASPWDINTPAGILDLRTGAVSPHDRDARCTKVTNVSVATDEDYHEGNPGFDEWMKFIRHVTAGDAEFARYLQQLSGMAAVGKVYEEGLVISYGPGGNGKSTLFGALKEVLGDYAKTINADVLAAQGGRTDQSYVAALRGARLAIMGETEEGARLGVAQMKRITSRDVITARMLYRDPMEFTPTHTVIMHTNYLPRISSMDDGTKRRIAVAPFPATLPPERVITDYGSVLVERCGSIILRWIVEGAKSFYSAGCKLIKPQAVLDATRQYLQEEDAVQNFIDECCEVGADYTVRGGDLYRAFAHWCEQNGAWERSQTLFGRVLSAKGYDAVVLPGGLRVRRGMRLREAVDGEL